MAKTKSKGLVSKAEDVMRYRPKPTISIDSRDLKGVKDMQVGKSYTFTVTAKVKSVSAGDEYDDWDDERTDKSTRARLTITKITEK